MSWAVVQQLSAAHLGLFLYFIALWKSCLAFTGSSLSHSKYHLWFLTLCPASELTLDYNYFPNTIVNPWFPTLPLPAVDSSASGEALPFADGDDMKVAAAGCCFAGMPWICPEHCQMEEIFNLCFTDLQSTGALLHIDTCSQLQSCLAARGQTATWNSGRFFSPGTAVSAKMCRVKKDENAWGCFGRIALVVVIRFLVEGSNCKCPYTGAVFPHRSNFYLKRICSCVNKQNKRTHN